MNTKNMNALRAAVAVALGVSPMFAAATIYSPGSPVLLASEITYNEGQQIRLVGSQAINFTFKELGGRTIDTNVTPLEVRLKLTDGATFANTLTTDAFRCNYTAGGSNPTIATALNVVNGAAGDSVVTFKMKDGVFTTVDGKQICQFSGIIKINSGSTKDYGMSVSAYLKSPAESDQVKLDNIAGSIVSFKQAYLLTVSPNEVTINVASPYYSQKFGAAGTVSAVLGSFSYAAVDPTKILKPNSLSDGSLVTVALSDVLAGGTKIVLTGDPLRTPNLLVARQATTTLAADQCKTVVVAGGPYEVKTASVASGAVSFDSVAATEFEHAAFCLIASGSDRIEKGAITFTLTKPTGSGANLDVAGDRILSTLKKNGTSIKVLNLPAPDDISETVNIRVYNMSPNETKIYGTLYDMNGAIVGSKSNAELATVPANGVKVINAKSIGSVLGVTTWTGRGWLQLEGDAQGIRVQALAYTGQPSATGARTIINMSDRVKADSER